MLGYKLIHGGKRGHMFDANCTLGDAIALAHFTDMD